MVALLKKFLFFSFFLATVLQAEIIEIDQIDAVRPYITENTLCLFDIDDTLIDNPIQLGSSPWRSWVKPKILNDHTDFVLYDILTLYIAQNTSYKMVESSTAQLITDLQANETTVFAFTARGRSQWYTTDIEGIDQFTHKQLNAVGIDFSKTRIPEELQFLESTYFYDGIIFAQHIKKGDLLKHLFKDLKYTPSLIIFIDDKLDQVKSVEAVAAEVGIPCLGFWYRRSEIDRASFNPMVANIQLEALLLKGEVINDEMAMDLAKEKSNEDPQVYLKEILEKIDIKLLSEPIHPAVK